MTTGEKIRSARQKAGLTQKQLGELCGIAEPTIRRYELGKLNPKKETLEKIAKPLEVYYLDLYGDEKSKEIASYIKAGMKLGLNAQVSEQQRDFLKPFRERGYTFTEAERQAVALFNQLNGINQQKAITNLATVYLNQCIAADQKVSVERTDTPQPTPAPQEGTDTTPPPEGTEGPQKDE